MPSEFLAHRTGRTAGPIRRDIVSVSLVLLGSLLPPSGALAESPGELLNLNIAELGAIKVDTVSGASRFTEKVTDAASSVTVITRDEISKFGHRTLADILRSARSFDAWDDSNYSYTGARGFNSLNDYGSRTLLLIDGHRMNDPIFDTNAVGTEGFLDVDLIERVELIRGPGSAIYGSNAFFGVINVITRTGQSLNGVEAAASGGSRETYSGRLTIGKSLPNGLDYLFSATTYASGGRERIYYPEFDTRTTNRGIASRQDSDRFWSMLGKISYADFTLQGGYVTRDKNIPTGSFGTVFNEPSFAVDSRGYVELRYAKETAGGWSLGGRAHYDFYDYSAGGLYDEGTGPVVNDDSARARWWGIEANATKTFFNNFRFGLGAELRKSSKLHQRNYDGSPYTSYLDVSGKLLSIGAYADLRWQIHPTLSLGAGLRWDRYDSFGDTLNPRASIVWKPRESTAIKFLFGEAFRAPNHYQLDYNGPGQRSNPSLEPEKVRTYELVAEHYLDTHWKGSFTVFRNEIGCIIDTSEDPDGTYFFANKSGARVQGIEAEIEGKWDSGWMVRASYTRQDSTDELTGTRLLNSPTNVAKAQVTVPLYADKLFGTLELLYADGRLTLGGNETDDALVLNATLFSRELRPGLELSASVHNVLGQKFSTPGGSEHLQDALEQEGRSVRLKISQQF